MSSHCKNNIKLFLAIKDYVINEVPLKLINPLF